jgi:hypothetical protein
MRSITPWPRKALSIRYTHDSFLLYTSSSINQSFNQSEIYTWRSLAYKRKLFLFYLGYFYRLFLTFIFCGLVLRLLLCCLMQCQDGYACHGGPDFLSSVDFLICVFYLGSSVSYMICGRRRRWNWSGSCYRMQEFLAQSLLKKLGIIQELLDLDLATFSLVSRVFV